MKNNRPIIQRHGQTGARPCTTAGFPIWRGSVLKRPSPAAAPLGAKGKRSLSRVSNSRAHREPSMSRKKSPDPRFYEDDHTPVSPTDKRFWFPGLIARPGPENLIAA